MADETLSTNLFLTPAAWQYLIVQQGALSPLAAGPKAWRTAYFDKLRKTLDEIEPFLPSGGVQSILDVGGGMSGIGALLSRKYDGAELTIIDGMSDQPEVRTHAQTFSHARVAEAFLRENGVKRIHFLDANAPLPRPLPEFDLIVSFQAWAFHFPPNVYLPWVTRSAKQGAMLILDLRKDRPAWAVQLFSQEGLEPIGEVENEGAKYTRMAFMVDRK